MKLKKEKQKSSIFKKMSSIEIPEIMLNSIKTGDRCLDTCFSQLDGLIPSQIVLITGGPGAGKTTLMMTLLSKINIVNPTRPSIYISMEMSDFQLKMQSKKIKDEEGGLNLVELITDEPKSKDDVLQWLSSSLELNPTCIIVDSLQYVVDSLPGSKVVNLKWVVDIFKTFAKVNFIPIILIGHVTKGGQYRGSTSLLHAVDSHLHLSVDKKTKERSFSMMKNRFGGMTTDTYGFILNDNGVSFFPYTDEIEMDVNPDIESGEQIQVLENEDYFDKSLIDCFHDISITPELFKLLFEHIALCYKMKYNINDTLVYDEMMTEYDVKYIGNGQYNFGYSSESFTQKRETYEIFNTKEKPMFIKFFNAYSTTQQNYVIWNIIHLFAHHKTGIRKHNTRMVEAIYEIATSLSMFFRK